jgi:hypothetical protein
MSGQHIRLEHVASITRLMLCLVSLNHTSSHCSILEKHILNGMTQFSWQPKAENLSTEFAAGWMLFLVCATGAQLG